MASILPYIIGQIIPDCDVHYHCLLLVIQILSICLAPVVTDNVVAYLRVLIEEHHQLFREIYKDESFIPKLHYMVHYPNQIVRHGPLVRSWTMRHEAKLNFFKQASRLSNIKNLTLTLAKRHQLWLAYHIHTKTLFNNEPVRGPILQSNRLTNEDGELITLIRNYQIVQLKTLSLD